MNQEILQLIVERTQWPTAKSPDDVSNAVYDYLNVFYNYSDEKADAISSAVYDYLSLLYDGKGQYL